MLNIQEDLPVPIVLKEYLLKEAEKYTDPVEVFKLLNALENVPELEDLTLESFAFSGPTYMPHFVLSARYNQELGTVGSISKLLTEQTGMEFEPDYSSSRTSVSGVRYYFQKGRTFALIDLKPYQKD